MQHHQKSRAFLKTPHAIAEDSRPKTQRHLTKMVHIKHEKNAN